MEEKFCPKCGKEISNTKVCRECTRKLEQTELSTATAKSRIIWPLIITASIIVVATAIAFLAPLATPNKPVPQSKPSETVAEIEFNTMAASEILELLRKTGLCKNVAPRENFKPVEELITSYDADKVRHCEKTGEPADGSFFIWAKQSKLELFERLDGRDVTTNVRGKNWVIQFFGDAFVFEPVAQDIARLYGGTAD